MLTFFLELQESFFSTGTVMLKSIFFFQICFYYMRILSSNCGKLTYIETE